MKDLKEAKEKAWEELRAKYDYSMPGSKKGYKKGFFGGFDAGVKAERERVMKILKFCINLKSHEETSRALCLSWRKLFPEKEGGESE